MAYSVALDQRGGRRAQDDRAPAAPHRCAVFARGTRAPTSSPAAGASIQAQPPPVARLEVQARLNHHQPHGRRCKPGSPKGWRQRPPLGCSSLTTTTINNNAAVTSMTTAFSFRYCAARLLADNHPLAQLAGHGEGDGLGAAVELLGGGGGLLGSTLSITRGDRKSVVRERV